METEEDWLSCKLKLCELTTQSYPSHQSSLDVVFDIQSCPEPVYDKSSLLASLETYIWAFNNTGSGSTIRQGGEKELSGADASSVHHFAEAMIKDILDSLNPLEAGRSNSIENSVDHSSKSVFPLTDTITAARQREDDTIWNLKHGGKDRMAVRLVSEIYSDALEEVLRLSGIHGFHKELRSGAHTKDLVQSSMVVQEGQFHQNQTELTLTSFGSLYKHKDEEGMEVDTVLSDDILSALPKTHVPDSRATNQYSGPLTYPSSLYGMSQLGSGSLDYPDAPPSTPLLPEMVRSRASFTRKLKGGLAKEFLPSPPPPTPKENETEPLLVEGPDGAADEREFTVRLMRSLSLECRQSGEHGQTHLDSINSKVGPQNWNTFSKLSDHATRLDTGILSWISMRESDICCNEHEVFTDMQCIADQWADKIITASLAEVMTHRLQGTREAAGKTDQMNGTGMEELRALAGELNTEALDHALTELAHGSLETDAGPLHLRPALQPMMESPDQTPPLLKSFPQTSEDQNYNRESDTDDRRLHHTQAMTSVIDHSYAENLAMEVAEYSVQQASKYFMDQGMKSDELGEQGIAWVAETPVILNDGRRRVMVSLVGDKLCSKTQELQCALLWAVASKTGASVLQIHSADRQLEQQLHSLAQRARLLGLAVEDLMTSLLQYSKQLHKASRGHCGSSVSLLEHLQGSFGQSQKT